LALKGKLEIEELLQCVASKVRSNVVLLVICWVLGLLLAGGKAIEEKGVHAGDVRNLQCVAEMIRVK
jgi:hypothetical protein